MPVSILRYVVFGICLHNYSMIYQKKNVREGNIRKSVAPGGENSLTGGLFGALNGAGASTRAVARVERRNAQPWAIDWGGEGNWGGGPPVFGPRRPRNKH